MKKKNKRAMVAYYSDILFNTFRNIDMAHFIPLDNKLQKLVVAIDPVQDLHGYSNPWPEGGGKNKFNINGYASLNPAWTISGEILSSNNNSYQPYVSQNFVSTGEDVVISCQAICSEDRTYCVQVYNADTDTQVGRHEFPQGTENFSNVVSLPAGTNYNLRFFGYGASSGTASITNIQLEVGNTATSYAPYSNICPITGHTSVNVIVSTSTNPLDGTITNIPLGQTVYGGTLDVVRGVLTVTYGIVTDLSQLTWVSYSSERYIIRADVPGKANGVHNLISSRYKTSDAPSHNDVGFKFYEIIGIDNETFSNRIYISDPEVYSDYTLLTGAQLVFELATPIEVSLTPMQINTIVGSWNYVWCDSGKIIEIEA